MKVSTWVAIGCAAFSVVMIFAISWCYDEMEKKDKRITELEKRLLPQPTIIWRSDPGKFEFKPEDLDTPKPPVNPKDKEPGT